jgi:hypothetical protein
VHDRFNPLERPDRYDDRLETERHSEAASRAACGVRSIGTPPPGITAWERRYYFRTAAEIAADSAYDAQIERYNAEALIYFQALDQYKKDCQHDQAHRHLPRPVRPVWPRRG